MNLAGSEVVVRPTVDARGELGLIDVEAIEKNGKQSWRVKCRSSEPAMSFVVIGTVVGKTDEVGMIDVDSVSSGRAFFLSEKD